MQSTYEGIGMASRPCIILYNIMALAFMVLTSVPASLCSVVVGVPNTLVRRVGIENPTGDPSLNHLYLMIAFLVYRLQTDDAYIQPVVLLLFYMLHHVFQDVLF